MSPIHFSAAALDGARSVHRVAHVSRICQLSVASTATHTHTAPMLRNVAPTLFSTPIPPEHQANIDRYTREFVDKLEQVAVEAVKNVRPARLM